MEERPAGWFPDPNGRHEHRYFNGRSWTADVADGGIRSVDPFGTSATPTGAMPSGGQFGGAAVAPLPTKNGIATAALVCGIIGVLLAWMPFLVVAGFVLAVLALVFGVQGIRRANVTNTGRGLAVSGVVLGAVGVALSVVGVLISIAAIREVRDFMNPAPHEVAIVDCVVSGGTAQATGTITNRGDERTGFTVFIQIAVGGERSEHVERIDPIDPGESAEWDATDFSPGPGETCLATTDVYGPFPFDVPMDRP